ncbi:MAG TPA: Fic family protein [Vicinamibacterales bacterium]
MPRNTGVYITSSMSGERVRAFVPRPLPPKPPLRLDGELARRFDEAAAALTRLDAASDLLPSASVLLYSFVRKEAVLSSEIEGTQSSLADLLLWELEEAPGVPLSDVEEVSRYVAALEHGVARVRGGFPLSARLLREIHAELMTGAPDAKAPGEFRRTQNWIGGTRPGNAHFVPPPPDRLAGCLSALEQFLHDKPARTPPLIKAALAHVQFETIHPFLDGNGRVGRLLITLILCVENVLRQPLLYLSLYFKQHRAVYYRKLDRVRTDGDWEGWCEFFADGVIETATNAFATAQRLNELFTEDRTRITALGAKASRSALAVHGVLEQRPLASAGHLAGATGLSFPTIAGALARLEELGVVREITGRKRGRVFAYENYMQMLNEGSSGPRRPGRPE